MSGGGQGGYGGGMGGGYQPRGGGFGGYGQGNPMQNFGSFGGQSFGGGNPWMRQQGQQQYGNKMGFQGAPWMSQPSMGGPGQGGMPAQPGGGWNTRPQPNPGGQSFNEMGGKIGLQDQGAAQLDALYAQRQAAQGANGGGDPNVNAGQFAAARNAFDSMAGAQGAGAPWLAMGGKPMASPEFTMGNGVRNFQRNDMRTIPGETYASGAPSNPYSPSGASPSIGGPGQGGPSSMPGSAFGMPVNVADQAKAGNMYGPQGAMSPPGAYDAMVAQGQQEYDARMKMPAQWGRYADGSPREDPNGLNARGQAHQGWYGGGWGR